MTTQPAQFEQAILRDILRIIAEAPAPSKTLPALLTSTAELIGAQSIALIMFEEPFLVVRRNMDEADLPPYEALKVFAYNVGGGLHYNPVIEGLHSPHPYTALANIASQKMLYATLWLTSSKPLHEVGESLGVALNAFTIITKQIHAQARQERINRNQGEFIRIVSHDLRSPLTVMKGFADMLEGGMAGEMSKQQSHCVEKIQSGISQMTTLVENIQDAGRYDPETGFYELQRAPCDLVDIVRKIVDNHLLPAEKQELTITSEIQDVPVISADKTMLDRAITNLVDNAIKYTPNGGNVHVSLLFNREDGLISVSVKDSGFGISEENQKHLFERHYRIARNEHKRIKGSGLGLFIVRSVAKHHGGRAWVKSIEGEGSTFGITIPLTAGESED